MRQTHRASRSASRHVPRHAARRGATLVEFAFIVPILLVVLLGIIEFGWYARNQLAIANATREGARVASIGKPQSEIRTRVVNSAKPVVINTNDITLQRSTDSGVNWTALGDKATTPAQNGAEPGDLVRVSLSAAHRRLTGLPITPARINVQVSMVRER